MNLEDGVSMVVREKEGDRQSGRREVGRGSKTEAGTEEKKGGRMDGPEKGD